MQDLANKVWANPAFHRAADSIQRAWISREIQVGDHVLPSISEAKKVVQAAAILACSNRGEHRQKAYQAATSTFELYGSDEAPLNQATRVVLARLGNFPAILTRGSIESALGSMPLRLISEELSESDKRTVTFQNAEVTLTRFQHRLWTRLRARKRVAIAAPTSAGKSFVLENFLTSQFADRLNHTVIYVVPTRALIAQVSNDLRSIVGSRTAGPSAIDIVTVPLEPSTELPGRAVYVMTQERLQLMMIAHPRFSAEVIVVDEAQTIADGARGVLLQSVIEMLVQRRPACQLLFASPGIKNLDMFGRILGLSDIETLDSGEPTVSQNFIVVDVQDERKGEVRISLLGADRKYSEVANFRFDRRTKTRVEKLVNSAIAFGQGASSIVYANGAADAEEIALELADRLAFRDPTGEQLALTQLIAEAVHQSYALVDCVQRGVGFHYSNMPTQVRQAIEQAFANGVLDYLVCTSTLLQGVNSPAKNVFMCRPEKGKYQPLQSVDFWNLAGRAGRLLKEFQGNIFLIDYSSWRKKPLEQERTVDVIPSLESGITSRANDLLRVIERPESYSDGDMEAVYLRLLGDLRHGSLDHLLHRIAPVQSDAELTLPIREAINRAAAEIHLTDDILAQNPNISPYKQQKLYDILFSIASKSPADAQALIPPHPRDEGAFEAYSNILKVCHQVILRLKPESRYHRFLALIALWWMQGRPLPRIVQNQLDRGNPSNKRSIVRDTLDLVEKEVRYQCVRLFSCYSTILSKVLNDLGGPIEAQNLPSLALFLEIGASDRTTVSLISIGLSRVVAVRLAAQAPSTELNVEETRTWLNFRPVESLGLSPLLEEEVRMVLKTFDETRPSG